MPLARRLQAALGAATPRAAIEAVVARALGDARERELSAAIDLCDFRGLTTHTAAAQLSLSPRQFFRYRAEAIAAVAASVQSILDVRKDEVQHGTLLAEAVRLSDPELWARLRGSADTPDIGQRYRFVRAGLWSETEPGRSTVPSACAAREGQDALTMLYAAEANSLHGRYEEASRALDETRGFLRSNAGTTPSDFIATQLARLDFEGAQRVGDAKRRAMIAHALSAASERGMSTAARHEPARITALLIEADALALEGDALRSTTILSRIPCANVSELETLARVALISAKNAYVRERDEQAHDYASAALRLAPLDATITGPAHTLCGLAALHLGRSWRRPESGLGYHDAMLEAVAARHRLAAGRYREALCAARDAVAAARRHAARTVEAYALATMSTAQELMGDPDSARTIRLLAFRAFATSHDAIVARDIFLWPQLPQRDLGALHVDLAFAELLWSFKEQFFPEYRKPVHARLRPLQIANLQYRALVAGNNAATAPSESRAEPVLHGHAIDLLAAMQREHLDPNGALTLARATLRSHWFPSAAFLPTRERESYRRSFMLVAETFYTLIERHYRDDVAPCGLCEQPPFDRPRRPSNGRLCTVPAPCRGATA
ncbi:MAG: hypothetical protein M3R44_02200 [Candidatus Eremiobacteraeota bacterium]|nr:hypothetical protein [Candidatus Eremiobacteraeota bacterium]